MKKDDTPQRVSLSAWYSLAVLTLIYVCHSVDRSVMSIVIEPMKAEFNLTDSQVGIMTGLAYATLYALAGIPIGYLIDRTNRRNLLALLVTVWSACTAICGITQSYWQLLIARLTVGASEAGGAPTALSMISDLFPEKRRSTAVSIFWLSTAIGTAVSFGLGGYVAATHGWRAAFLVAGAPGLLLAILLLLTVREPERGAMDPRKSGDAKPTAQNAPSLLETLKFALSSAPIRNVFIAVAFKSCVLSGVLVWAASYFIRVQGLPIEQAGVIVGLSIAIFGGCGSLLGGVVGDRAYKIGGLKAQPLVPFVTSLATAVVVVIFATTTNLYIAIAAFAVFEIASRMHTAPSYSFLISSAPPRMRGVIISCLQIGSNLIGYGFGPFIVGTISDKVGGPDSIRYGLLTLAAISVWVSFHFYMASRLTPAVTDTVDTQAEAAAN